MNPPELDPPHIARIRAIPRTQRSDEDNEILIRFLQERAKRRREGLPPPERIPDIRVPTPWGTAERQREVLLAPIAPYRYDREIPTTRDTRRQTVISEGEKQGILALYDVTKIGTSMNVLVQRFSEGTIDAETFTLHLRVLMEYRLQNSGTPEIATNVYKDDFFLGANSRKRGMSLYQNVEFSGTKIDGIISSGIEIADLISLAKFNATVIQSNSRVAIVSKVRGKFIAAYFEDGVIKIASPCSPGKDNASNEVLSYIQSRKGVLPTLGTREQDNRSSNFTTREGGVPMPFTRPWEMKSNEIAFHGGFVDGNPQSHGCFRLPYAFAYLFFRLDMPSEVDRYNARVDRGDIAGPKKEKIRLFFSGYDNISHVSS